MIRIHVTIPPEDAGALGGYLRRYGNRGTLGETLRIAANVMQRAGVRFDDYTLTDAHEVTVSVPVILSESGEASYTDIRGEVYPPLPTGAPPSQATRIEILLDDSEGV